MNALKIDFLNFYPTFSKEFNYFYKVMLKCGFPVKLSKKPEFVFCGDYGTEHFDHKYDLTTKIYITEEPLEPDFNEFDYAITSRHRTEPYHLRSPVYARSIFHWTDGNQNTMLKNSDFDLFEAEEVLARKTNFCNFVYRNGNPQTRNSFFELLSKYKQVDSGGVFMNNLGSSVPNTWKDKLKFISPYKFTIAFENMSIPGYITEKLVHPLMVNSLPIYWGHPTVIADFDPLSFLNAHEHRTLESLMERVIEMDKNDMLYLAYLRQPCFHNNIINQCCTPEYMGNFFKKVFYDHSRRESRLSKGSNTSGSTVKSDWQVVFNQKWKKLWNEFGDYKH